MCSENQLEIILSAVATQSKLLFEEKLNSVILFGSYARGDYDDESDIDIMILADIADEDVYHFTRQLYEKLYLIGLENDVVLSLCIVPHNRFYRFKDVLPFYSNVAKEGIKIAI